MVSQKMIERKYKRETVIHLRGEPIDRVFILRSGKVKMYRTDPDGKKSLLTYHHQGDLFPLYGFFQSAVFQADAHAEEDSVLLVITLEDMNQLLKEYPELSQRVITLMGQRMLELEQQWSETIIFDVQERLIMLLLRLAQDVSRPYQGSWVKLTEKFTNRELAQMIGSTRETVSRILNRLKRQGIVGGHQGYLLIHVAHLESRIEEH
ncbi:transcriptional regulator [Marinithermofilum abyssi]|uniref:Transcriptional regulator n=1 Tax=Marinithermofilum abyssi TaxID=1571185 RepID=A0A8J2VEQ2_9BACL|nr:Crp/Fnr family transcriptional regulator [Marinithermofilum abyssi]GGE13003.1 transcriptional regulator [Marinithermofilum abyssi]